MEAIAKAIGTFVNDLHQILTAHKFGEMGTFINKYLHEHPDEIDNGYSAYSSVPFLQFL